MARARNIKPGFFKNEELVELPFQTRLLFAGLWTLSDREGRLEDRPKRIKMEIFPGDDVDVALELSRLSEAGLVHQYMARGNRCIEIINFKKHQNPHHREPESELPDPTEEELQVSENKEASESPGQAQGKPQESRADSGFLIPDSGEKKCVDASDDAPARDQHSDSSEDPDPDPDPQLPKHLTEAEFEDFWARVRSQWYGRPGAPKEARTEFKKIKRSDINPEELTELALQDCRMRWREYRREGFAESMKHVCRWLKNRCWESVEESPVRPVPNHWAIPKSTDEEAMERDMAAVDEHLKGCI